MLKINFIRYTLASCLLVAVWSVSSMVALASSGGQQDVTASITVSGNVTVDNRPAITNNTIVSGSTITTGESGNSIATVDLGKLGRLELLSQSSLVLKFEQNGIYGTLLVGKVRIMNMSGVTTTVATKEGMVVGGVNQANTFTVETECGRTLVNTQLGSALLRAGGEDRQIAAGSEAVAGSLSQTGCRPCMRPDPNQEFETAFPRGSFLAGALLPILAGVVGGAIYLSTSQGSEIETGGGGIVVSTTQ